MLKKRRDMRRSNMGKKGFFCLCFCFWMALYPVAPVRGNTPAPEVAFLDQLAIQGIPAGYGVILGELTDNATIALKEGVVGKSGDLAKLANQKVWRDKISNVSQAIGRLAAILDVGGKVYSGQTDDAIVAGGLAILTELAGSAAGKELLKAYGFTPPVISALVISVQIGWESHKALAQATVGSQLEQLYGTVENMTGNNVGRTLGQGDPFPVTPANLELVWKRILNDSNFRELFRVYAVNQLGMTDFPDPGFFDKFEAYIALPTVYGVAGAVSSTERWLDGSYEEAERLFPSYNPLKTGAEYLESQTRRRLQEQYEQIKPHVAGLVGHLNRAAKTREQLVAAQRRLLDLQAQLGAGSSVEDVFEKLQHALAMTGVVEVYLSKCMTAIATAADEEDYRALQVHMAMSVDYVRDVVAWLPATGPTAELHKELLAGLKASYAAARSAFEAFRQELRNRIDTPKPPQETVPSSPVAGDVVEVSIDPASYYNEHFKPLLEPFDWGGLGSSDDIRKLYETLLEAGQFAPPKGVPILRSDHAPLADALERAWQVQNFPAAVNPPPVVNQVPQPDPRQTIEGYKNDLLYKVKLGYPESITGLQRSIDEQSAVINKERKRGDDMWWGRDPKPPANETHEQRTARRDAATAIINATIPAIESLQAERQRLDAMKKAWEQAKQMAQAAAAARVAETQMEYDAVTVWMKGLRAERNNLFLTIAHKRQDLVGRLSALSLASIEEIDNPDAQSHLGWVEKQLEANAYTYLTAGLFSEDRYSVRNIEHRLVSYADRLIDQSNTMRRIGNAAAEAARRADAFEKSCRTVKALKSEYAEDIARIRQYLDPAFLSDDDFAKRLAGTPALAGKLRSAAEQFAAQAEQNAGNMLADGVWLRQVAGVFNRFVSLGSSLGIMEISGYEGSGYGFSTPAVNGGLVTLHQPYTHYLTETEKAENSAQLRSLWNDTPLKAFSDRLAPWLTEVVHNYFDQLNDLPGYNEDNFLVRTPGGWPSMPITHSQLERAENRMAGVSPGTEDFKEAFNSLAGILPLAMKYDRENGNVLTPESVEVPEGLDMARRYMAFRAGIIESHARHAELWAAAEKERRGQALIQARAQLPGMIAVLNDRIRQGERLIEQSAGIADNDRPAISEAITALSDFGDNRLLADPYFQALELLQTVRLGDGRDTSLVRSSEQAVQAIGRLSMEITLTINRLRARQTIRPPDLNALAKAFYARFRSAYESRDTMQVMRCLDDRWSAGDGTTLHDLEVTFSRMFDLFDNIRFDLSALKVEPVSEYTVRASYSVVITGRIYQSRLTHVERSTVHEEVLLDGERSRILQTMQGSFWYSN
jgi:hypothetical protein